MSTSTIIIIGLVFGIIRLLGVVLKLSLRLAQPPRYQIHHGYGPAANGHGCLDTLLFLFIGLMGLVTVAMLL
jgi:hypothetical protein